MKIRVFRSVLSTLFPIVFAGALFAVLSVAILPLSFDLLGIGEVRAQQQTSSETEQNTPKPNDDAEAGDAKAEPASRGASQDNSNSNNNRPGEVFKPTEEISEDSPVPFPVDI